MQRDSDLAKAFQHFRRDPIGAGVYPCPRDWHGMAPAALALKAARAKVEALPGLQAAHAAALAALAAPLDVTQEAAAYDAAQAAYGAAKEAEEAAGAAYHAAQLAGAFPAPDFGPFAQAMKARRSAAADLDAARKALESAKAQEGLKAAAKRAGELLQWGRRFQSARPVWNKGTAWHGPQSGGGVYFDKESAADMFRNIEAARNCFSRYDIPRDFGPYYADEYQENTCGGFVLQLRGRKGRVLYLPGFQFSETDGEGFTVDLRGRSIESARGDNWEEARREAAKAADGMAESAAEKERDYQEAWRAGSDWADSKEREADLRAKALAILAERRAARSINPVAFPALCAALRDKVESILSDIQESRAKRAELKDSVYGSQGRAAFSEGAGVNLWEGKAY